MIAEDCHCLFILKLMDSQGTDAIYVTPVSEVELGQQRERGATIQSRLPHLPWRLVTDDEVKRLLPLCDSSATFEAWGAAPKTAWDWVGGSHGHQ